MQASPQIRHAGIISAATATCGAKLNCMLPECAILLRDAGIYVYAFFSFANKYSHMLVRVCCLEDFAAWLLSAFTECLQISR